MNKKYLIALGAFFVIMYLMIFVEHFFTATKIANIDTCTLEKQTLNTGKYDCIAAKAVHQDAMGNTFVYLVKEKQSILGNELVSTIKYIDIIAKDDDYIAINPDSSQVTPSDLIVLHSDRALAQGSKIRLLE